MTGDDTITTTATTHARLLSGTPGRADLADHIQRHRPLPDLDGAQILERVEQSGLTGRGGAAFPTGRKMRTVATGAAGRRGTRRVGAVVVANGCEGEPASAKDHSLLVHAPHLVLDGIALAARAVGATETYLCVHEDEAETISGLRRALGERAAAGVDSGAVRLVTVPHRYVASEESALVRLVNGGPALPMFTPPRPFEQGVHGKPTLVNNVETLAQVALIARHGPAWFRSVGTPAAPGTTLVTIGGAVVYPGVREIPLGITGGELLALAGGPSEPLQAVLAGGYFGAWLSASAAHTTRVTPGDLASAGAAMGAGIFLALPQGSCGLAETARVAHYLAEQSAGQCGPCLNGLPALAAALDALAFKGDRRVPDHLSKLSRFITGRGACRHPDGATRLIASALSVFAADVRTHANRGPCAGARRAPVLPVPSLPLLSPVKV